MNKIIIFGNSGSGKSTMAKHYADKYQLAHLDLDTIAWQDTNPPTRKPTIESQKAIEQFCKDNETWIIEGCYSDLLNLACKQATQMIFLNPGIETCIENCKNRPWEPHKYASIEEQNKNLPMLINWVKDYYIRTDDFSFASHDLLFKGFKGNKEQFSTNQKL